MEIIFIIIVVIICIKNKIMFSKFNQITKEKAIQNGDDFYMDNHGGLIDLETGKQYSQKYINGEICRVDIKTGEFIRKGW